MNGQIKIEEKEIIRAEKSLTATTRLALKNLTKQFFKIYLLELCRLPADAQAYKTRVEAEGMRSKKIRRAEADAEKIRLIGAANAKALELVRLSLLCHILN